MNEQEQSRMTWRKSTRSNGQNNCLEATSIEGGVAFRDSKQHGKGDVLRFTAAEFKSLLQAVKDGEL